MKKIRQIFFTILAVVLFAAAFTVPALALEGYAGEQVTVSIPYSNTNSISGSISYSNAALFSSVEASVTGGLSGVVEANTVAVYGTEITSGSIVLTCTIAASAKTGDSCTISLTATVGDENFNESDYSNSVTVTVKEKTPAKPPVTPVAPPVTPTTPPVTPTNPPVTDPEQPEENGTALEKTISDALKLSGAEYTTESWAVFSAALSDAQEIQDEGDPEAVEAADIALQTAMEKLVRMNYQPLRDAIAEAKAYFAENISAESHGQLYAALAEAEDLLHSGDQKATDRAAQKINELLAMPEENDAPVEEQKEPGSGKNVILIVSLILNGLFILLIVFYFVKKHKNHRDTTPLVDYDISDDEQ